MEENSDEKLVIVLAVGVFVISFLVILTNGANIYFNE